MQRARELLNGPKRYPEVPKDVLYGDRYIAHVSAMTAEGLHSKADIAEQLALRDDAIAALLAEIERLKADKDAGAADYCRLSDDRDAQFVRAEAAEARLRELAEAEPVAWAKFDGTEITHMEMSNGSGADLDLEGHGFVRLIRRPEMPS